MEITLRLATDDDAPQVADVLLSSRKTFLPYAALRTDEDIHNWTRTALLPAGGVTTAIAAGSVVGMVATAREDGVSWITQLYVAPAHVGQGIGKLLISHALARLPMPVRLWCFQRNVHARRFYERRGFRPIQYTDGRSNEERCPDVLYEIAR